MHMQVVAIHSLPGWRFASCGALLTWPFFRRFPRRVCGRSTVRLSTQKVYYDCLPRLHLPSPSNSDDSSNCQSVHVLLFQKLNCDALDTTVIHSQVVPFPPDSHHLLFCCHPFTVLETCINAQPGNVALYTPEYTSLTPGICTIFVQVLTGYDCSVPPKPAA